MSIDKYYILLCKAISEIPCLVIELPALAVTPLKNSAKNGEVLIGVPHQGRDVEGKIIPWEPSTNFWKKGKGLLLTPQMTADIFPAVKQYPQDHANHDGQKQI